MCRQREKNGFRLVSRKWGQKNFLEWIRYRKWIPWSRESYILVVTESRPSNRWSDGLNFKTCLLSDLHENFELSDLNRTVQISWIRECTVSLTTGNPSPKASISSPQSYLHGLILCQLRKHILVLGSYSHKPDKTWRSSFFSLPLIQLLWIM